MQTKVNLYLVVDNYRLVPTNKVKQINKKNKKVNNKSRKQKLLQQYNLMISKQHKKLQDKLLDKRNKPNQILHYLELQLKIKGHCLVQVVKIKDHYLELQQEDYLEAINNKQRNKKNKQNHNKK